jgi:hypothetical protein
MKPSKVKEEMKPELPIGEMQQPVAQMEDKILDVGALRLGDEAKPIKPTSVLPSKVMDLIESGIPVRKIVFQTNILFNFNDATPESTFLSKDWAKDVPKKRLAKIWLTPHGLIIEHRGEYKIVPLANVQETTL